MIVGRANIRRDRSVCLAILIAGTAGALAPDALAGQTSLAHLGEPAVEIGEITGEPSLVFGQITDVAVLPSGEILAVDGQYRTLSAFTASGDPLVEAGGEGRGPGDFVYPSAVGVMGDEVLVLDAGAMRVERFRLTEAAFEHLGGVTLPFSARSFCVIGDWMVLLGYHEGSLLHRVDLDGELLGSFGDEIQEDPIIARLAGNGHLTCVPGGRPWIGVATWNFPEVFAYELDGTLRWQATIPGFDGGDIGRSESGSGVRFGPTADGGNPDVVISVVELGGRLAVQFGPMLEGMGALEDVTQVRSVWFDGEDGTILQETDEMQRIDARAGAHVLSRGNDPFPRIQIYRHTNQE